MPFHMIPFHMIRKIDYGCVNCIVFSGEFLLPTVMSLWRKELSILAESGTGYDNIKLNIKKKNISVI